MKCEDTQKRLKAFVSNDLDSQDKNEIQNHLDFCEDCSRELQQMTELSQLVHKWTSPELSPHVFEKIKSQLNGKH